MKFKTIEITLTGLFVAFMAVGANITSLAPFMKIGGVPITLQTFFAVLAGSILGSRTGTMAMFAYMMIGLVGAPVFANFKGGPETFFSPTFGFILSYILVAYIIGKIVSKKENKITFIAASIIGMLINYIIGTNWMYFAYKLWSSAPAGFSYKMAWLWMVVPLPKDVVLSIFAGLLAFRIQRIAYLKRQIKKLNQA